MRNLIPETRRAFQGRGDVEGRPESHGQHDGWPLGSPENVTGGFMDLHGEMKRPRSENPVVKSMGMPW